MVRRQRKWNTAKKKQGFTLIEMLIAVLVFSISLASLMLVSSQSLKSSRYSKEYVVASYLALEGVEFIHNMRDQAILSRDINSGEWNLIFPGEGVFGGDGCFNGDGSCNLYFEGGEPKLGKCSSCNIFFRNGRYIQTYQDSPIGKETEYHRKVIIKQSPDNDNEIFVLVTVYWDGGGVSYGENLYLYQ